MFMLTNYNSLCYYIDIKSLIFCQIWWVKKLLHYYFQINYCKGKVNGAADALLQFPQKSDKKEKKFWFKNF